MSARDKFISCVVDQLGKPVLMGGRAPDVFDCSELVAWGLFQSGGPDQRNTHTAQRYHDECTRPLADAEQPIPGDLVFYGSNEKTVVHVAIWLAGGHCLSADGATRAITDLEVAKRKGCAVRAHSHILYRRDLPYVVVRRFVALDSLDKVTR